MRQPADAGGSGSSRVAGEGEEVGASNSIDTKSSFIAWFIEPATARASPADSPDGCHPPLTATLLHAGAPPPQNPGTATRQQDLPGSRKPAPAASPPLPPLRQQQQQVCAGQCLGFCRQRSNSGRSSSEPSSRVATRDLDVMTLIPRILCKI